MNLGSLLFGFQGRINRAKYWLAALVYFVLWVVLGALGLAAGPDSIVFSLVNMVVGIGTFISNIAVGVKRLHDRNKTGWWLLLFYVLPGILVTAAAVSGLIAVGSALDAVTSQSIASFGVAGFLLMGAFAVVLWAFIELGCLRGTVGPNRYGPDPLALPVVSPAH
jgi:uncharacterized membrane protein YhaH (DUF805 family)